MNHVPIVELTGQHEPGHRYQIHPKIEIELIAELVAEVVAEGVSVKGRSKLVQAMWEDFIGLVDHPLKAYLPSPKLRSRLHRLSITCGAGGFLSPVSSRKIHAKRRHEHASECGKRVVFGSHENVADTIIGEAGQLPVTAIDGRAQTVYVLVFSAHIRQRDLKSEPLGYTVVEIQCVGLGDRPDLPVMVQNELPIVHVHRRNNPGRPVQQGPLPRIVVKGIDCEQSDWSNLLL